MLGVIDQAEELLQTLIFAGGGAQIKSIQSGTTSLTTTQSDVTISAVDLSKAFAAFSLTGAGSASESGGVKVTAKLTTSTNMRLQRGAAQTTPVVSWMVVEFAAGISVQQVEQGMNMVSTVDVTISAVNTSRAFVLVSDRHNATGSLADILQQSVRGSLTGPTTLNLTRGTNNIIVIAAVAFIVEVK